MSAALRVGLVLDSKWLWAWQWTLLQKLTRSDYARIVLVVFNGAAEGRTDIEPRVPRSRLLQPVLAWLLERAHHMLEARIECEHDAFAAVDGAELLAGVPHIDLGAQTAGHAARSSKCDVVLDLRSGTAGSTLPIGAKYGVWTLDDLDFPLGRGAPPGFWAIYAGRYVTRMGLSAVGADGEQRVLAASFPATQLASVKLNRSNAYWNALHLVPGKLAELHRCGEKALGRATVPEVPGGASRFGAPTVKALGLHIARNIRRRAAERMTRAFTVQQWILMFHRGDRLSTTVSQFQAIVPPADRYWADPHVVFRDGKHYVFLEEYPFATAKGHIAVLAIDGEGRHEGTSTVLERPYHLSYPFVFEHGDELYMVPESMDNRTVELYRCVAFPGQWELVRTLLTDIEAVDSTLVEHAGKWWLFANVREHPGGSPSEQLFLFHADSFDTGAWSPHPKNPIVADATRARPAGPIQKIDGELYRPAQDCSVRYGYAMGINRITAWSTEDYAETEVERIEPDRGRHIVATHSLAYASGLTIIDALVERRKFL